MYWEQLNRYATLFGWTVREQAAVWLVVHYNGYAHDAWGCTLATAIGPEEDPFVIMDQVIEGAQVLCQGLYPGYAQKKWERGLPLEVLALNRLQQSVRSVHASHTRHIQGLRQTKMPRLRV